uniref:uncharacterized protein si:dkey-1h24.6 n=1 Tax=Scatophagus argus TaxID=75038 RepID=UPI001ED83BDE|nr:uncharacterized protein si:dkey-1h24.6 [Scatophagus argus]
MPRGCLSAGGEFTLSVQRIKMSAWWTFMILLGCRLSHAAQSQSTCIFNYQLKTVCVPARGNASVPCPELSTGEAKFNLFHDEQIIYNLTCESKGDTPQCKPPHRTVGVEPHVNSENNSVSFVLTGVNASHHGVYRCERTSLFPPPLITASSQVWIVVLVEGHQCRKMCTNESENNDGKNEGQTCGFHWLWIVVVVSVYSIIVTVVAVVIWVKLRKVDTDNDYMNTKPRAHRERRKKKGLLNPVPRYC